MLTQAKQTNIGRITRIVILYILFVLVWCWSFFYKLQETVKRRSLYTHIAKQQTKHSDYILSRVKITWLDVFNISTLNVHYNFTYDHSSNHFFWSQCRLRINWTIFDNICRQYEDDLDCRYSLRVIGSEMVPQEQLKYRIWCNKILWLKGKMMKTI